MSNTFVLMQQEGYLARSAFLTGFDNLIKANISGKSLGLFYSAFFQLTIGVERIMKLILILNHMSKNELKMPTVRHLKEYGHGLIKLYSTCKKIAEQEAIEIHELSSLEFDILSFLNQFASSSRYYNLDILTNNQEFEDPLLSWKLIIEDIAMKQFYEEWTELQAIRKVTIPNSLDERMALASMKNIYVAKLIDMVAPHGVWHVYNCFSSMYELIYQLNSKIHEMEYQRQIRNSLVPHMHEFFKFFLYDQEKVLST